MTEALELSSFLDKLSDGNVSLRHRNSTSVELSTLDYSDWVSGFVCYLCTVKFVLEIN